MLSSSPSILFSIHPLFSFFRLSLFIHFLSFLLFHSFSSRLTFPLFIWPSIHKTSTPFVHSSLPSIRSSILLLHPSSNLHFFLKCIQTLVMSLITHPFFLPTIHLILSSSSRCHTLTSSPRYLHAITHSVIKHLHHQTLTSSNTHVTTQNSHTHTH